MYSIDEYRFAESLDEAAELLGKNRRNAVIGSGTWMRLGNRHIHTAIDLSRLGLDSIRETDSAIEIGASVTLRQLETAPCLQTLFGGVLPRCVAPIVGVQLRNLATVGANVYSRHGFSDLITALLALDTSVTLHKAGTMSLEDFLADPPRRDILTGLTVRKDGRRAVYLSQRRTETDLALLTLCLSVSEQNDYRLSIGARPGVAALCPAAAEALSRGDVEAAAKAAAETMTYDDNMRSSALYRRALAGVLTRRAWDALQEV